MKTVHRAAEFLRCSVLEVMAHPDRDSLVRIGAECAFVDALVSGIQHDQDGLSWPEWYTPSQ